MSGFRRPSWWALLLTVAGALLFVRLGFWQLHRADFKEMLLRRYAAAAAAPVQDFLPASSATGPFGAGSSASDGASVVRIRVHGRYLVDRLYLLDNPKHDGLGGVEVFVPLALRDDSRLLLVDLGFLPGNGNGKQPQVPPLPAGKVSLQGLYVPMPPVGFEMGGNALAQQSHWPKTTIFLDPVEVADDLGKSLYPHLLALDADPASIYVRVHTLDFSSMPPARHRAYAFQWFTFALAAVVILLIVHRKRKPRKSDSTKVDDVR